MFIPVFHTVLGAMIVLSSILYMSKPVLLALCRASSVLSVSVLRVGEAARRAWRGVSRRYCCFSR